MAKRDLKKKSRDERLAGQAAYDERTRRLEDALRRRGVPTGDEPAAVAARSRIVEAAVERHTRRERS